MGKRSEQTLLQSTRTDGQQTREKMLLSSNHLGSANQTTVRLITLIRHSSEVLVTAIGEEEIKGIQIGNKKYNYHMQMT